MKVGIISDTHGLLRPEALDALRGAEHIIHAGDVGDPSILDRLRELAPLTAIRGNIDRSGPCAALPASDLVELAGHLVYVLHNINELDLNPAAAGIGAVIYGHSHKPALTEKNGVLYLNPGSAGPRRFSLPLGIAFLHLQRGSVTADLVPLNVT